MPASKHATQQENKRFGDYVTSMAFNLSLSKAMILVLGQIATNTHCTGRRDIYVAFGGHDTYVTSGRCLKDRGLIYSPDKEHPGLYELTEAGALVVELLRVAGLIQKIEAENVRIYGKKSLPKRKAA